MPSGERINDFDVYLGTYAILATSLGLELAYLMPLEISSMARFSLEMLPVLLLLSKTVMPTSLQR
jgi:hypothetical protein